jgi:tRNA(Ile)-lysidine synthase
MTGLHQRIQRTIRHEALLPAGSRVVVGVSGGADSVALLHLLLDLSARGEFSVAGLAHFNHQLRPTADRDEDFCRDLAATLRLEIAVERGNVAAYARQETLSVEDAARRLRYRFLEEVASRWSADRIAVGHTVDDQAETVLLKLIRGAGLTGLGGVSPRRGRVVRPLLGVAKRELVAYLQGRQAAWLEDETNADLANPRNRLRHLVLPELERAYPGAARSLARAADASRADAELLEAEAEALYEALARPTPTGVEIDAGPLTAAPAAIVRRVLLKAMRAVCGNREIGLDHIRAAEDVLAGSCAGTDVPGARWELRRKKLVLSQQGRGRSDTLTE